MYIYLEFRITKLTEAGVTAGLELKDKMDSIRWKEKPMFMLATHELEGAVYDIYPVGVYQDPNTDLNLRTLIVKAVYKKDPNIVFYNQIGGFVPREDETNDTVIDTIPLHITTDIYETNPYQEYIDNIGPMEGGIRAEINGYLPWMGSNEPIAETVIENNVVHNLYEYIPFKCPVYETQDYYVLDNNGLQVVDNNGVVVIDEQSIPTTLFKENVKQKCSR